MGGTAVEKSEITEEDPFTPLYDDGSFDVNVQFNSAGEALDSVMEKWRDKTKIVRISELPKA